MPCVFVSVCFFEFCERSGDALSTEALKSSLRQALLEFRRERPQLSLRAIAKHSGVNRYFLNKLIDETDESSSLDLNQVLVLSKFITERDSVKEAIQASSHDVQQALKKIFNVDYLNQKNISSQLKDLNLYDSDIYFILVLASYSHGTKKELISKILGQKGELVLDRLLKENILVRTHDRIRLAEGNEFTLSTDVLKQRIPDYLKFYNYERNFQQKNFIHVYSEGLNRKAIRKIYELHASMNKEIQKILLKEENHGDIPFFSFACMDQMCEVEENKEEKLIQEQAHAKLEVEPEAYNFSDMIAGDLAPTLIGGES